MNEGLISANDAATLRCFGPAINRTLLPLPLPVAT